MGIDLVLIIWQKTWLHEMLCKYDLNIFSNIQNLL
jgi:flagellar biosynthesis protein FliQ